MGFEEVLYGYLSACESLCLLVGTRIYPLIAVQGATEPYITYQLVSNISLSTLQGDEAAQKPIYQFNVFSKEYSKLKTVLRQLKQCIKAFNGSFGQTQKVVIQNSRIITELINYEPDTGKYQGIMEVQFWVNEENN